jgi:hypothetical protein
MRVALALGAVAFVGVLSVIACVGSDSTPAADAPQANDGLNGGRCFANGTCVGDLVCEKGLCGPGPTTGDGGDRGDGGNATDDAGNKEPTDSGVAASCDLGPPPNALGSGPNCSPDGGSNFACPNATDACCAPDTLRGFGTCVFAVASGCLQASATEAIIGCDSANRCSASGPARVCCFSYGTAHGCTYNGNKATCASACGDGEIELCSGDSQQCTDKTKRCQTVLLVLPNGSMAPVTEPHGACL